jgi:hypothetical protein
MSLNGNQFNVRSVNGINISNLLTQTADDYATLQQEVATLELNTDESLNSLNDRIGTVEVEYSSLLDSTATLTSDITVIQAVDATQSSDITSLQGDVSTLQSTVTTQGGLIVGLTSSGAYQQERLPPYSRRTPP